MISSSTHRRSRQGALPAVAVETARTARDDVQRAMRVMIISFSASISNRRRA